MVQLGNVNICRPLYSGDGCTKIQVKINQSILNSYISIFTSKRVYFVSTKIHRYTAGNAL